MAFDAIKHHREVIDSGHKIACYFLFLCIE
jgi:hypothetical protein